MESGSDSAESFSKQDLVELLAEHEALLADGFETALRGAVTGWFAKGHGTVALYDYNGCVEVLLAEGMTEEEAHEHLEFNVLGAWVGEGTPAFAFLID